MRSDKSSLSVVQDALGLGAGKVDTAYSAMDKTIEMVNEIKDKLVAATGASADRQGQDPDRNHGAAGAAQDGRRRRHLLRLQLAVAQHHHRQPPSAGVADVAKIVAAFTRSAAGAICCRRIDINVADASSSTMPSRRYGQHTKGILDGVRLGTSGVRDNTAHRRCQPARSPPPTATPSPR